MTMTASLKQLLSKFSLTGWRNSVYQVKPNEAIQWQTQETESTQQTVCGLCHRLHIKPTVRKQKQKPLKTQEMRLGRNQTTIQKARKPRSVFTTKRPSEKTKNKKKQKSRLQTTHQQHQKHQTLKLLQTVSLVFIEKATWRKDVSEVKSSVATHEFQLLRWRSF